MTIKKRKTKRKNKFKRNTKKIGGMLGMINKVKGSLTSQVQGKIADGQSKVQGITYNPLLSNMGQAQDNNPTLTGPMSALKGSIPSVNPIGDPSKMLPSVNPIVNKEPSKMLSSALPSVNPIVNGDPAKMLPSGITNTLVKGDPTKLLSSALPSSMQGNPLDIKNKIQEHIKKYTEKLKYFKGNPLLGFFIKTFARIYEDNTLLNQIYKSKYIQRNKYLKYIKKLYDVDNPDKLGQNNYQAACCLIYKYYYKNIALNYSYLRESDYMSKNCKDKKYIEAQLKLYNSTERKNVENFKKVFYERDQFSIMTDTDNVTDMKEKIENAFIIPKNGIIDPLINNYSYLILYILHDIHSNIDAENIKKAEKLKQTKKIKDDTPPKYDITKDAKCTPHKDADVTCDPKDIAISIMAETNTDTT